MIYTQMGENADSSSTFHCFWPQHANAYIYDYCSKFSFGTVFRKSASSAIFLLFSIIILIGLLSNWMDDAIFPTRRTPLMKKHFQQLEIPLNCSANQGLPHTCRHGYPPTIFEPDNSSSSATCPEYFRWIHEDLRPWKSTGITREMVERGKEFAHLRLVILKGKAYVEKFSKPVFQTRDLFTIWGILQLLRLYPGRVPNLELMFSLGDRTVIDKRNYQGPNSMSPPPVFHYCGRDRSLDIPFPDWTFWGWGETNIRPWEGKLRAIEEGNNRVKWLDRVPYAHWKGNPRVAAVRRDLMKCNVSNKYDWNARLYDVDWRKETEEGYKTSKLEDQCTHRYKIYVEGAAWSVSEKYIFACDSMKLLIKPEYYDFFTRSLMPVKHYWPIRGEKKCEDIEFAVEWGNNHTEEAQAIGKAGSDFMKEDLAMENIYDYMFHSLSEYAKLLRFEPEVPPGANRVCSETVACSQKGLWKKFMVESLVQSPREKAPCALPPAYEAAELQAFVDRKKNVTRQVEILGIEYWEKKERKQ